MALPKIELWGEEPRRWVQFSRAMWLSDKQQMVELGRKAQAGEIGLSDFQLGLLATIEPLIAAKSWDGPLANMTGEDLDHIIRAWAEQTDDDAVPQASGTQSPTRSGPGASAKPRVTRRPSR